MPIFDTSSLRHWFLMHRRSLPWREEPSPYRVWVSEIMLQQTQVNVVIPYFQRWMVRFPNIQTLAKSPIEDVIKLWEGLGYYSRAKNLHRAAQFICENMHGQLPVDAEQLSRIPGLGPYTVGAIRAFAFHQRAAAVDGNVLRVLSRYFAIQENIDKPATQKTLRKFAEEILPKKEPWIISEALIELGALVCKKQPLCEECALKNSCKAYVEGLTAVLPLRSQRIATTPLYRTVPILLSDQRFLIRQIPEGQVMAGLHEFPYFETEKEGLNADELVEKIFEQFKIKAQPLQLLPTVAHGFTRYTVRLQPFILSCSNAKTPPGYFWAQAADLPALAFSSGHRRLVGHLDSLIDIC